MPIALFQTESGDQCRMLVDDRAVDALVPHAPGLRVPFRFEPSRPSSPERLTWDLSYLHAEIWSTPQAGSRYYASMLPEFTTREHRPHVMRFPIDAAAFAQMEEMRQGGDLNVVLHVQATLVGTLPRDRVPDAARRRTLEAWGLSSEMVGPIRHSYDLPLSVPKMVWEEQVLPQWACASIPLLAGLSPMPFPVAGDRSLDVQAMARTLAGATKVADFEAILRQCRMPILGL